MTNLLHVCVPVCLSPGCMTSVRDVDKGLLQWAVDSKVPHTEIPGVCRFELCRAVFQLHRMKTVFPEEVIGQGPENVFEPLLIQKP